MFQDLRYALRMLAKSPGFTIIAVLTLALGMGATTAIFSMIYGVLFRPLRVPTADRIAEVVLNFRGEMDDNGFTYPQFRFIQEHSGWSDAVVSFTHVGFNLSAGEEARRISALRVSSEFFRALGAHPLWGRDFSADEDTDAGARVAILSFGLWNEAFSGDSGIIGKTVHLDGQPFEIIGVMPPDASSVQLDWVPPAFGDLNHVDLWTTLAPVAKTIGSGENLTVIGRLRPGLTLVQANAQIQAINGTFRQEQLGPGSTEKSLALAGVQRILGANVSRYLWILLGGVGFVLLITCANVSNLLLTRVSSRRKEAALRGALGASRGRIVRQFVTESVVLSLFGGVVGILVAQASLAALLRMAPAQLPRIEEIRVDGWAFGFAFCISLLAAGVFGLAPALRVAKSDVNAVLKESSSQSSAGRGSGRLRDILISLEIAISVVLLVGASLLGESFLNLLRVDPGFQPRGVLSAEFWLTGSRLHSTEGLNAFYDDLAARLKEQPGVEGVAIASLGQPLERGGNFPVTVNGQFLGAMEFRVVTPDYFRVLQIRLKNGRTLTAADSETSEPVAVVNEAFVQRILNGGDALRAVVSSKGNDEARRIVGVVADVKSHVELAENPAVFIPAAQTKFPLLTAFDSWFPTHVFVRTKGDPAALSTAVHLAIHNADMSVPVGRILMMEQVLARSISSQRFLMQGVTIFAGLAIILAAVGIYGVTSFSVSQRTQELGIRLALGAEPSSIVALVLREGLRVAAFGMVAGIAGAFALYRALSSVLFGVQATDLPTMAACTVLFLGIATLACYVPARRATRVDPITALRYE